VIGRGPTPEVSEEVARQRWDEKITQSAGTAGTNQMSDAEACGKGKVSSRTSSNGFDRSPHKTEAPASIVRDWKPG
jgi:hypothetical protein